MYAARMGVVATVWVGLLFVLQGSGCDPTGPSLVCGDVSGSITENTTLSQDCYDVTSSVYVSGGATLTISPGVTLRFAQDTRMDVQETGRLAAVGTAAEPITFTGVQATPGYWGGLRLYNSNSTVNELDYVTIEYGGGYYDANLYVAGNSRLAVTNCTLSDSETFGFIIDDDDAVVSAFSGNVVTSNADGAGSVHANVAHCLDDSSTYIGNDLDIVVIESSAVSDAQTWQGIDADYYVDTTVGLRVTTDLVLEPGVQLVFDSTQERFEVTSTGSLSAVGTAGSPIVMTGAEQTAGYWGGLQFYNSNAVANELDYVTIEYGGGYYNANLQVAGNSRLAVTNCTLSDSGTYGFIINADDAIVSAFSDNIVTGNVEGAGSVNANVAHYLDDSSTYVGNDLDIVVIESSTVSDDQTWQAIDADYYVDTTIGLRVTAGLVLAPGVRLVFDSAQERFAVTSTGSLSAVGTAVAPIVMTGAEQTAGYWGGLEFYNSNAVANELDYVTIAYGGGYYYANLYVNGTSRVDVTNCTISYSGTRGAYIDEDDATVNGDIESANTFTGNTLADVEYF